jgi:hypothetical protein
LLRRWRSSSRKQALEEQGRWIRQTGPEFRVQPNRSSDEEHFKQLIEPAPAGDSPLSVDTAQAPPSVVAEEDFGTWTTVTPGGSSTGSSTGSSSAPTTIENQLEPTTETPFADAAT